VLLDEKSQKGNTVFTVEVLIDGESMGKGMGQNKKKAEQAAAEKAFNNLQSSKDKNS
jgi:dsRNA-specific ribonuclease